jgi:hypothetical protein
MSRASNDSEIEMDELVRELHHDLARNYRNHRSIGNVCELVPEINLRDIAESGPNYFLDLLEYRATKSLTKQYGEGLNRSPGDCHFILISMRYYNFSHVMPSRNCFTMFMDGGGYGKSYEIVSKSAEIMAGLSTAIEAGVRVPQSTGDLILLRQLYTLQALNILVGDILDASTTRMPDERPKKLQVTHAAFSILTIGHTANKPLLQDLVAQALDQKSALDDYFKLLCTEPVFVAHAVSNWFFSRPDLIQDEKGRRTPHHTNRYISISFF